MRSGEAEGRERNHTQRESIALDLKTDRCRRKTSPPSRELSAGEQLQAIANYPTKVSVPLAHSIEEARTLGDCTVSKRHWQSSSHAQRRVQRSNRECVLPWPTCKASQTQGHAILGAG